MSLENVQAYENFNTLVIAQATAPAGYATLKSLLSPAALAQLAGRPVCRVELRKASAAMNVASSASPSADVLALATTDVLTLASLSALDQVHVNSAGGSTTFNIIIYLA